MRILHADGLIRQGLMMLDHEPKNEHKDALSVHEYVREYRTLRLGLPRQCGKTTFVTRNAMCGDIIVVPNRCMQKQYLEAFRPAITIQQAIDCNYYIRDLPKNKMYPETIWFDEVRFDQIYDAYEFMHVMIGRKEQRVVCLGTM